MKRRQYTTGMAFIASALFVQAKVKTQPGSKSKALQGTRGTDLESALYNLNLFDKKPQVVNQLVAVAWGILSTNANASFSDLVENSAFQQICEDNGFASIGGPMLGNIQSDGASVWVRTLKPAAVEVHVLDGGVSRVFGPVQTTLESGCVATVGVNGLMADTRYRYQVIIDGSPIDIPASAELVTAPLSTEMGTVRLTFGSCFHRWGLGNQAQANEILKRDPAAMLLIGDIAAQDREGHLGLLHLDYMIRDLHPAWNDLVARVPVYATWDDHDYWKNDGWGVPRNGTVADAQKNCDLFQEVWNNPSYGFDDERRGVFLRSRVGPCDVVMVDNRYFRTGRKCSFLGEDQMKWLEDQLLDCQGPFIVLSCGSMWSDYVSDGKDSWGKVDPEGRERIFSFIEKNNIAGVLLISGDRHGARGFTIPRPSGYEFYEFEAGSLGGRFGPPATSPGWKTQFYGMSDEYAFGEFSIDATSSDPEVTFRLIGDTGNCICEKTITRSQLTPRA